MPRTRGPAHDRTRERILKTARALVVKNGFDQLSLREIARRAGFSPASLYEYFPSKAEIIRTLGRHAGTELGERLTAAASGASGPLERIIDVGLAYVRYATEQREDFLMFFSRLPASRRTLSQSVPTTSPYSILLDAVVQAQDRGELKMGDPGPLAYSAWALAHGQAMLQLTHLATFKAEFAIADRRAFEALVHGWAARE